MKYGSREKQSKFLEMKIFVLSVFTLLLFLTMFIQCSDNDSSVIPNGAIQSRGPGHGIVRIRHSSAGNHGTCDRPLGICIIIIFDTDPLDSDESGAYFALDGSNNMYIEPDSVLWDHDGVVPITDTLALPSSISTTLGLGSTKILPGQYTVSTAGPKPRVYVNYQ